MFALAAAVALFPTSPNSPATAASQSPQESDPLTAQAQSQLDQLFGAGHSTIVANAAYTGASDTVTRSYSSRGSAPLAASNVTGSVTGSGGYSASSVQNGVGQSVTRTSNPGGAITRLSVAVVVDASKHPNLRAVRRTVAAAMGLVPARGDRLSVVAAPMTLPVTASVATPSWPSRIAPYGPSTAAVILALGCAVALVGARRAPVRRDGRSRHQGTPAEGEPRRGSRG